jgi:hypothetical protein
MCFYSKYVSVKHLRRAVSDPRTYRKNFIRTYRIEKFDKLQWKKYLQTIETIERSIGCKISTLIFEEDTLFERWDCAIQEDYDQDT